MYHLTPKTMAKIYGLFGSMQGKVADVVMAVRNGEQIVRKYQPVVSNPSTPNQVEARAKLKLMSQLSAIFAPVIAIPKQGSVSSRNLFVKENYRNATYNNNQADVTLTGIHLTKSVVPLSGVVVTREDNNTLNVSTAFDPEISRVVYCLVRKGDGGALLLDATSVVSVPGSKYNFPTTMSMNYRYEGVVYAYGIRDNTEAARAKYGNVQALTAETIAKLIVTRTLTESDVTLTSTSAVVVPVSEPIP